MLSSSYKKFGCLFIIVSFLAFLSTLIAISSSFKINVKSSGIFGWFLLGGLIVVTFSKEKYETKEIEMLRLKCFFKGFFTALAGIVVGSLSTYLFLEKRLLWKELLDI